MRGFYIIATIAIIVNIFIGFFVFDYFDWETMHYGVNWYITLGINTFLWYLNLAAGIFLFCKRKNSGDESFNVSETDHNRIKKQMWILIFGYASIYTLTLLWFISFPIYFEDDVDWPEEHYWIAINEKSGFCALIKSILLICPTLILWLTFFYFRIPKVYNQSINFGFTLHEESNQKIDLDVAPAQLP